ncbi:hypothetical protein SAMN04489729_4486 [Amycolatopsis lurida]|uniref:Uncharacterized protein n=1 Tax=Amycolatopsis lurida NRRL 2430 TaxID=1460371 RepID=A0A2P2FV26_AMYLU|nr:hypothetical protein [Amycolatopsis lurida]KFU80577.1 hypothetical protein BB31_13505 [Amycolatopsis lurida NRRL 2430]SED48932.1 hypothetical protein SAMN04489729_4486 [Amycolatopsis lurida]
MNGKTGRWIGGVVLILAPLVWCAGLLLRHLVLKDFTPEQVAWFDQQPFAAPGQLAAYAANPGFVTAAYSLFLLGAVLLLPAFLMLAKIVAAKSPALAAWGFLLLAFGLFARVYFAGVELTAFELVDKLGLDHATKLVMDDYVDLSYGLWRIPVTASVGQYAGGLLLAIGAFRAGTFGIVRALLFLWPCTLWMGVLKESELLSVFTAVALGLALVPLGIRVLTRPADRQAGETSPAS